MMRAKGDFLTFSDGWAEVWKVTDRRLTECRQAVAHFHEATVGERRYWDAQVSGVEIVRAVNVPEQTQVQRGDVLIIEGQQYEVAQKDRKDTKPASWLLSLKEAVIRYGTG